jgi:hypothetical protein
MIKKISDISKVNKLIFKKLYIFPNNRFSTFLSKKIQSKKNLFFVDNLKKNKKNLIHPNKIEDSNKNIIIFTNIDVLKYFNNKRLKKIKKIIFYEKNKPTVDLDKNKINLESLNKIFLHFNCDKGSYYLENGKKFHSHNYAKFYEKVFFHLIHKKIKILELGAAYGASAASFINYFKKVKIITTDINKDIFKYRSKKIKFIKLDYLNKKQVKSFKKNKKFDIIIDDGDHSKSHILKNFKNFFNLVNKNGYYVIEDIGFSENFDYKNDDKNELSVLSILTNLKKKKNFESNYLSCFDQARLFKNITDIKIFNGKMKKNNKLISIIAFIKKN